MQEQIKNPAITITPELPIGTELWFMHKNRIMLALVAGYRVNVTSNIENDGWYDQLFRRWRKWAYGNDPTLFNAWKYNTEITIKIQGDICAYTLRKDKQGHYDVCGKRAYLSKEELIETL